MPYERFRPPAGVTAPGLILFAGDPHGRFAHILEAAREVDYEAVVVLGDLDLARPLADELGAISDRLWWIHGNYDSDTPEAWTHLTDGPMAGRGLHGRAVELPSGLRLAGLGGVFRARVWDPGSAGRPTYWSQAEHAAATPRQDRWRGVGPPRRHLSTIYPDDVEQLLMARTDVLVTHEAPSYHRHGVAALDGLARAMGARLVVHGHHHEDAIAPSTGWTDRPFLSVGIGLRGLAAIDAAGRVAIVRPGE